MRAGYTSGFCSNAVPSLRFDTELARRLVNELVVGWNDIFEIYVLRYIYKG